MPLEDNRTKEHSQHLTKTQLARTCYAMMAC